MSDQENNDRFDEDFTLREYESQMENVLNGKIGLNQAVNQLYHSYPAFRDLGVVDQLITPEEKRFAQCVLAGSRLCLNGKINFDRFGIRIYHDFSEICLHGSLDKARKSGFWPMSYGWSKYIN